MQKIQQSFDYQDSLALRQYSYVESDERTLKDIVRGVYFYNNGNLTDGAIPNHKIDIITEFHIKKISSIIKIQKVWKGYRLRKSLKQQVSSDYTRQRAAVKIQRWVRQLSLRHRNNFMKDNAQQLKKFDSDTFYIRLSDYFSIINQQESMSSFSSRMTFPQQMISPYLNNSTKDLDLFWRHDTNSGIIQNNFIFKKGLFHQNFMEQCLGKQYHKPKIGYFTFPNYEDFLEKYTQLQLSHIFHYQTMISIISKKLKKKKSINDIQEDQDCLKEDQQEFKYLEVKCKSKYQCKLRVLALKLICYNFRKDSLFRRQNFITHKEYELKPDIQLKNQKEIKNQRSKVSISNNNAVFISQQIHRSQTSLVQEYGNYKNYQVQVKFYLQNSKNTSNLQNSFREKSTKKPVRVETCLNIILLENNLSYSASTNLQSEKKNKRLSLSNSQPKKYRSYSLQNNFPEMNINNYLISETDAAVLSENNDDGNQIKEKRKNTEKVQYQHHYILNNLQMALKSQQIPKIPYGCHIKSIMNRKKSLKNIKADRLLKLKKKKQLRELKEVEREQSYNYNLMINNGKYYESRQKELGQINTQKNERFTTQPDLTHERSLGSLASDQQFNMNSLKSINSESHKDNQTNLRPLKIRLNREQSNNNRKKNDSFLKKFVNQNNFLQNQFLTNEMKRLKTEEQFKSISKFEKMRTEKSQQKSKIEKFTQTKKKRVKTNKEGHEQLLLQNSFQKNEYYENRIKSISQQKQTNKNKSYLKNQTYLGSKKIKVTFAEECYPIISRSKKQS